MERARVGRLTRHQHVLLRLGELVACGECAASLARRARRAAAGEANEKTDKRFDATQLALLSRLYAREAALKIAGEGMCMATGSSGDASVVGGLGTALRLAEIYNAQSGLMADMDALADAVYGRQ